MRTSIPELSFIENLRLTLGLIAPNYLQGLFLRNKFWVALLSRRDDPAAVKLLSGLRRKYQSEIFMAKLGGSRTVICLNPSDFRRVLKLSPIVYGTASAKRTGMSHFQPTAVTISEGEEWAARRKFNERVLDTGQVSHHLSSGFQALVSEETEKCVRGRRHLAWNDLQRLFERIALRVIFGEVDLQAAGDLRKLMRQANRLFLLRRTRRHDRFFLRLRHHIRTAPSDSLAGLCRGTAETAGNPIPEDVVHQLPHWMFAIKDTLAENVCRAVAMIVSDADQLSAIRAELQSADPATGAGLSRLKWTRACLEETMRLWPTTPMLFRQMLAADLLDDHVVPAGTQVCLPVCTHHRDPVWHRDPDRFRPARILDENANDFFYFSAGAQGCPGSHLALDLGVGVLGTLLKSHRISLKKPALNLDRPLPYSLNAFALEFDVEPGR